MKESRGGIGAGGESRVIAAGDLRPTHTGGTATVEPLEGLVRPRGDSVRIRTTRMRMQQEVGVLLRWTDASEAESLGLDARTASPRSWAADGALAALDG